MSLDNSYNPDVLSCLANLSNDEVFTPPEVANAMLDMLPQEIFSEKNAKFLDPACKSGVFLREIAKRLLKGLENEIPDLQERVTHIFTKQLYAIAITELTSLLSRRSVYCSKDASGKYSVTEFEKTEGNIFYKNEKHLWIDHKCLHCGASEEQYGDVQRKGLETHAYQFIHSGIPGELENMKFDVIIGNPPYQLGDSGAFASAKPIYHYFVEKSKKLNPRHLVMVIPSRWFAGGKGLDSFRKNMLEDPRISELHDFPIGADCFPGTRIAGGVCYFVWNRDKKSDCLVCSHKGDEITSKMVRPLLEDGAETFIRLNEAVTILRKVAAKKETSFSTIVSARKPFGLPSDFFANPSKYNLPGIYEDELINGITIVGTYKYKTVNRYVQKNYPFPQGKELLSQYKVYVSQVLDNGFDWTKERLSPFIGEKDSACTETFLTVGGYDNRETAEHVMSYMNTKFFHILMFLKKVSHHVTSKVYEFVPMQDFSSNSEIDWNKSVPDIDKQLYTKYGLSDDEITFIETMICPME